MSPMPNGKVASAHLRIKRAHTDHLTLMRSSGGHWRSVVDADQLATSSGIMKHCTYTEVLMLG